MKISNDRSDYVRLRPGQKNPQGLQICQELALEYVALEDATWVSAACTASPRRECVMPEQCHHKRHGEKNDD